MVLPRRIAARLTRTRLMNRVKLFGIVGQACYSGVEGVLVMILLPGLGSSPLLAV